MGHELVRDFRNVVQRKYWIGAEARGHSIEIKMAK